MHLDEVCVKMADIVFIVDSSGSIGTNWPLVKDYVVRYINTLGTKVNEKEVRLGLVVYSTTATIYYNLNRYYDGASMVNVINGYVTVTAAATVDNHKSQMQLFLEHT